MQPESQQPIDISQSTYASNVPKKRPAKKILLILLGLLLLVGVGVGGWWYGTTQAEKEAEQQRIELQQEVDDLNKKVQELESSAATEEESENSFLVIKEWGVKLKPTSASMSYVIKRVDGVQVLRLTNTEVEKLGSNCETGLVSVSRYAQKQSETGAPMGEYIGKVGDFHYYLGASQSACSDNANEASVREALIQAAKTLQVE